MGYLLVKALHIALMLLEVYKRQVVHEIWLVRHQPRGRTVAEHQLY